MAAAPRPKWPPDRPDGGALQVNRSHVAPQCSHSSTARRRDALAKLLWDGGFACVSDSSAARSAGGRAALARKRDQSARKRGAVILARLSFVVPQAAFDLADGGVMLAPVRAMLASAVSMRVALAGDLSRPSRAHWRPAFRPCQLVPAQPLPSRIATATAADAVSPATPALQPGRSVYRVRQTARPPD